MAWEKSASYRPLPGNWKSIRAEVFRRAGRDVKNNRPALCEALVGLLECGNVATEVDHRIPRAEGGPDELWNLAALCADCHAVKTAGQKRERRGYRSAAPRRIPGFGAR